MPRLIAWIQRFAPTRVNRGLSSLTRTGFLHPDATAWLQFLTDVGRSPNTVRDYGRRVAWYLSWCALTMDWRKATLSHLALWRRTGVHHRQSFARAQWQVVSDDRCLNLAVERHCADCVFDTRDGQQREGHLVSRMSQGAQCVCQALGSFGGNRGRVAPCRTVAVWHAPRVPAWPVV